MNITMKPFAKRQLSARTKSPLRPGQPFGISSPSGKSILLILLLFFAAFNISLKAQIITTVAGGATGHGGYWGEGGLAVNAQLPSAANVVVDKDGNLYIAGGFTNPIVVKVDGKTGIITTIAGNDTVGFSGDGGLAIHAKLDVPAGVSVDTAGNLYISDAYNYRIRKVDKATGIITTIVGNGVLKVTGDGGPASSASTVAGATAWDYLGNMYLDDSLRIRKINPSGIISTIAGTKNRGCDADSIPAITASLNGALLCVDRYNNVYFASGDSCVIVRKINTATGIITRVAGTNDRIGIPYSGDGGKAINTHIYPFGVAVDDTGNLYIADYENNRIEKVNTSGIITTVAGTGVAGFSGDNSLAINAQVNHPENVAVDKCGNLYIADFGNGRIRKITFDSTCGQHSDTTNVVSVVNLGDYVKVWPNPAGKGITLTLSQGEGIYYVMNMVGEKVLDGTVKKGNNRIDIGALNDGIYFMEVDIEGQRVMKKFVKE
jgi:hypothetical protein